MGRQEPVASGGSRPRLCKNNGASLGHFRVVLRHLESSQARRCQGTALTPLGTLQSGSPIETAALTLEPGQHLDIPVPQPAISGEASRHLRDRPSGAGGVGLSWPGEAAIDYGSLRGTRADCSSTPTNYFAESGFILIPAAHTFAPVATPITGNALET